MLGIFKDCISLSELKINNFNTSKVKSMFAMFENCNNLISLDISNFNTSSLIKAGQMFFKCYELTSININFIGEKLKSTHYMFGYCKKLKSFDLSSLIGENIKEIDCMFYSSENLTNIDLSNFNLSSVEDFHLAFERISYGGTLKYNSDKLNATKILSKLDKSWTLIDVKNSN